MIRIAGETNGSHDPKLKLPLVASAGARAAAERAVSTGDVARLRKMIAALTARVAALEVNAHVPVDFTPMLNRIADLEAKSVTESVTALPIAVTEVTRSGNGNAPKLSAAEKQRAYRERQKAKA